MDANTTLDLNEALTGLLRKYAAEPSEPWRLDDGRLAAKEASPKVLTLSAGTPPAPEFVGQPRAAVAAS